MKRVIYFLMLALMVLGYSCTEDDENTAEPIYSVKAQLAYPDKEKPVEGIEVLFENKDDNAKSATAKTDANGMVEVKLTQGVYSVKVSEERTNGDEKFLYAINKEVTITAGWSSSKVISLELEKTDISKKYNVNVQLKYPDGDNPVKDVMVTLLRKTSEHKYENGTDENGKANFEVIKGTYTVSVSELRTIANKPFIFNATQEIEINENTDITLELTKTDKKYNIKAKLIYPNGFKAKKDIEVKVSKDAKVIETLKTNENGEIEFTNLVGTYTFQCTDNRIKNLKISLLEGSKTAIIPIDWDETKYIEVEMQKTKEQAQLITKELYTGGCPANDGGKYFRYDRYIMLYNNTEYPALITQDFALATTMPYNSSGSNNYLDGGTLIYEDKGWVPAGQGLWHFKRNVEVAPYSQIVIAIANAVDNTVTYSKSINFAHSEYFCTYDTEVWNHPATYVTPSEVIPTTNYLKAIAYGKGTAWCLSQPCPGFFMFSTKNTTLTDFVADESSTDATTFSYAKVKKVPTDWVIDGVEAFKYGKENNKRLTNDVDAGFINYTSQIGYSIYRNVDKEATEAIEGNKDKLVYGYSLGTESIPGGTTDPSGIDAEASIKNGAIIIYKDTNNTSEDFHQRAKASLSNY